MHNLGQIAQIGGSTKTNPVQLLRCGTAPRGQIVKSTKSNHKNLVANLLYIYAYMCYNESSKTKRTLF